MRAMARAPFRCASAKRAGTIVIDHHVREPFQDARWPEITTAGKPRRVVELGRQKDDAVDGPLA